MQLRHSKTSFRCAYFKKNDSSLQSIMLNRFDTFYAIHCTMIKKMQNGKYAEVCKSKI